MSESPGRYFASGTLWVRSGMGTFLGVVGGAGGSGFSPASHATSRRINARVRTPGSDTAYGPAQVPRLATPLSQLLFAQSESAAHTSPAAHLGHEPPQSMSDS